MSFSLCPLAYVIYIIHPDYKKCNRFPTIVEIFFRRLLKYFSDACKRKEDFSLATYGKLYQSNNFCIRCHPLYGVGILYSLSGRAYIKLSRRSNKSVCFNWYSGCSVILYFNVKAKSSLHFPNAISLPVFWPFRFMKCSKYLMTSLLPKIPFEITREIIYCLSVLEYWKIKRVMI